MSQVLDKYFIHFDIKSILCYMFWTRKRQVLSVCLVRKV